MDELRALLAQAASLAADFNDTLPDRPVFPQATLEELCSSLATPLPEQPTSLADVERTIAAYAGQFAAR
jgi:hypothetical protein